MADRIITWHIPRSIPNGVSLPRYYMDADYGKLALRVYAEVTPETSDLKIDIKAAGVSIFNNQSSKTFGTEGMRTVTPSTTTVLIAGDNAEEMAEDFTEDAIPKGSWLECEIANLAGARGVSIHLELERLDEVDESED